MNQPWRRIARDLTYIVLLGVLQILMKIQIKIAARTPAGPQRTEERALLAKFALVIGTLQRAYPKEPLCRNRT